MPSDPVHDDHSPNEHESLTSRRKRALLARAAQGVQRRLTTYRALAVAAVVALAALTAYTLNDGRSDAEPILLGTGEAGVEADSVDALAAADSLAMADASDLEALGEEIDGEHLEDGHASYYGHELAGNPTASGEDFDPALLTAAHRTLPLGSIVRVTNLRNDESVVVRINDRGPFHDNRIIDLSMEAARQIGMLRRGTVRVRIELLGQM